MAINNVEYVYRLKKVNNVKKTVLGVHYGRLWSSNIQSLCVDSVRDF